MAAPVAAPAETTSAEPLRPDAPPDVAPSLVRRLWAVPWVASTYFAEGYPYAIVNNLAEILPRLRGYDDRCAHSLALIRASSIV